MLVLIELLRGTGLECVDRCVPVPGLARCCLCSLESIDDVVMLSLEILKCSDAVAYALIYDYESTSWVPVISYGALLRNHSLIPDPTTKCGSPTLIANGVSIQEIKLVIGSLARESGNVRVSITKDTVRIQVSNKHIKALRKAQESLIRRKIPATIKCRKITEEEALKKIRQHPRTRLKH